MKDGIHALQNGIAKGVNTAADGQPRLCSIRRCAINFGRKLVSFPENQYQLFLDRRDCCTRKWTQFLKVQAGFPRRSRIGATHPRKTVRARRGCVAFQAGGCTGAVDVCYRPLVLFALPAKLVLSGLPVLLGPSTPDFCPLSLVAVRVRGTQAHPFAEH